MRVQRLFGAATVLVFAGVMVASLSVPVRGEGDRDGRQLFERETFGGNGRTCLTCHSRKTGTVSPADAKARFLADPHDPLFLHDGSDDGLGHGVTRMLSEATILMKIALPPNVRLAHSSDRFVTVRRGIPSTLNTPALDPTLMLDGRQPSLELQAQGAILDHAQAPAFPELGDLESLRFFQQTDLSFFSSFELKIRALGGPSPHLPRGTTASERRGRRFFEDVPPNPSAGFKPGLCAHCHSGTLMNQTNEFAPQFIQVPIPTATRFINILVGLFNKGNHPVQDFIFSTPGGDVPVSSTNPDGPSSRETSTTWTRSRSRRCVASGRPGPTSTTTPRRRSRRWPRTTPGSSPSSPIPTVRRVPRRGSSSSRRRTRPTWSRS